MTFGWTLFLSFPLLAKNTKRQGMEPCRETSTMFCQHVYCKLNPVTVWMRDAGHRRSTDWRFWIFTASLQRIFWGFEGVCGCRRCEVSYRPCLRTTHMGLEWELFHAGFPLLCVISPTMADCRPKHVASNTGNKYSKF